MNAIPHTDGNTAALAAVMCGKGQGFFDETKRPDTNRKKKPRRSRRMREKLAEAKKYAGGQDLLELL